MSRLYIHAIIKRLEANALKLSVISKESNI